MASALSICGLHHCPVAFSILSHVSAAPCFRTACAQWQLCAVSCLFDTVPCHFFCAVIYHFYRSPAFLPSAAHPFHLPHTARSGRTIKSLKWFFIISCGLLLFIAAGLVASGVVYFTSAGLFGTTFPYEVRAWRCLPQIWVPLQGGRPMGAAADTGCFNGVVWGLLACACKGRAAVHCAGLDLCCCC